MRSKARCCLLVLQLPHSLFWAAANRVSKTLFSAFLQALVRETPAAKQEAIKGRAKLALAAKLTIVSCLLANLATEEMGHGISISESQYSTLCYLLMLPSFSSITHNRNLQWPRGSRRSDGYLPETLFVVVASRREPHIVEILVSSFKICQSCCFYDVKTRSVRSG